MYLGLLKIKSIEKKTSFRKEPQNYKVLVLNPVLFHGESDINEEVEAERAIFQDWEEIKYNRNIDESGVVRAEVAREFYKKNPMYDSVKVGDYIYGTIVSFIANFIFENAEHHTTTISCVVFHEYENPLKLAVKRINYFPVSLTDWRGKEYKIDSKDYLPEWSKESFKPFHPFKT